MDQQTISTTYMVHGGEVKVVFGMPGEDACGFDQLNPCCQQAVPVDCSVF